MALASEAIADSLCSDYNFLDHLFLSHLPSSYFQKIPMKIPLEFGELFWNSGSFRGSGSGSVRSLAVSNILAQKQLSLEIFGELI